MMPEESLAVLRKHLTQQLDNCDNTLSKEFYTAFALLFISLTGARINEGVKVLLFEDCKVRKEGVGYSNYLIKIPPAKTKTVNPYTYYLPEAYDKYWRRMIEYRYELKKSKKTRYSHVYDHYNALCKSLHIDPKYTLRSIRCNIGSKWMRAAVEAELLHKDPPPNPLQHTSKKTIQDHYA